MEINTTLSAQDKALVQQAVNTQNAKNAAANGRVATQELGKDDFLKLLIAQLSNQDPTSPMENTEFIAQMAQFSSLEQMTNMSTEFSKLATMMNSSEAVSTIGKVVEIDNGDSVVTGIVESVTRSEDPKVYVNGMQYSLSQISKIYGNY